MSTESASASAISMSQVSYEQLFELLRSHCVAPPILKAMEKCQYGGPEFCDPDFLADAFSDDIKKECGVMPLHLRAFERIRAELLLPQRQHMTTAVKEAQGASSPVSSEAASVSSDAPNAVRCPRCCSIIPEEFVWKFFDPVEGKIVGWNCCCSVSFSAPFWRSFSHLPDIPRECNAIAVVELLSDAVDFLNNNKHISKVCVGSGGMGELDRCRFVTAVSFGTPERDFKGNISQIDGRLQELYMSDFALSDHDLAAIAEHCGGGTSLRGLRCCLLDGMSDAGLIRVITACKGLQLLQLSHCPGITNASIGAVATNCRELRVFHFEGRGMKVTDFDLLSLVTNCKELQVLDLGYCGNSETGAHIVAGSCKNLQTLRMATMTDTALATLAKNCKGLARLDLYSSIISTGALASLARNCKGLLHLHVRGDEITDIAVQALSVNCVNLRWLHLSPCPHITDAAVESLARHCNKRLEHVFMSCSKITDASVETLSANCTDLHSLGVSRCPQISDAAVHSVATHCNFLHKIELAETSITDASVKHLVNNCKELRRIDLSGCKHITDAAVHAVAGAASLMKKLSSLGLAGCAQVSDDAVALIRAKCKGVDGGCDVIFR